MNETLVVNPGENVTVQCLLTGGDPLPQLQWSHGPGPLPLGALAQGGTLSIPSVQARDSGYYNCTATNNVGNPAKKTVNLLVRCKWPEEGEGECREAGGGPCPPEATSELGRGPVYFPSIGETCLGGKFQALWFPCNSAVCQQEAEELKLM